MRYIAGLRCVAFSCLTALICAYPTLAQTAATAPYRDPAKQFGTLAYYPLAYPPSAAAIGDFNGDGFVDVAVAEYPAPGPAVQISMQLGRGDGTFEKGPVSPSTTTGYGTWLAAGDLNGDGKLDLVMSTYDGATKIGTVIVYLGNGDGTFTEGQTYIGGGSSATLADLNGDGILDIASNTIVGDGTELWYGNGDGTFRQGPVIAPCTYYGACVAWSPLVADMNRDGKVDLVMPSVGAGFYLALGNGDGTFQTPVFTSLPTNYAIEILGDFNNDGVPDVAYAGTAGYCDGSNRGNVGVALNNGDGTFQPATKEAGPQALCLGLTPVAADFNGDGKLDLIEATTLSLYLANGPAQFEGVEAGTLSSAWVAFAADLNGDGAPDVFLVDNFRNRLTVALNFSGDFNTVTSGTNPSTVGQAVTFTSYVTAGVTNPIVPTGTVTFADGSKTLGTATLSATGVATFTTSTLGAGNHTIHATYSGDATYIPKSAKIVQTVNH